MCVWRGGDYKPGRDWAKSRKRQRECVSVPSCVSALIRDKPQPPEPPQTWNIFLPGNNVTSLRHANTHRHTHSYAQRNTNKAAWYKHGHAFKRKRSIKTQLTDADETVYRIALQFTSPHAKLCMAGWNPTERWFVKMWNKNTAKCTYSLQWRHAFNFYRMTWWRGIVKSNQINLFYLFIFMFIYSPKKLCEWHITHYEKSLHYMASYSTTKVNSNIIPTW